MGCKTYIHGFEYSTVQTYCKLSTLQDGNLGPDPISTEVNEKTSIDVNGPWKKALFKFSNVSKIYFSTDNFPLVITPKLTSEFESTLNKVIYFSFSSKWGRFFNFCQSTDIRDYI